MPCPPRGGGGVWSLYEAPQEAGQGYEPSKYYAQQTNNTSTIAQCSYIKELYTELNMHRNNKFTLSTTEVNKNNRHTLFAIHPFSLAIYPMNRHLSKKMSQCCPSNKMSQFWEVQNRKQHTCKTDRALCQRGLEDTFCHRLTDTPQLDYCAELKHSHTHTHVCNCIFTPQCQNKRFLSN